MIQELKVPRNPLFHVLICALWHLSSCAILALPGNISWPIKWQCSMDNYYQFVLPQGLVAPCQNGGTCILVNSFGMCLCPSGWMGVLCEKKINCFSGLVDLCMHGGHCVSGEHCECPPTNVGPFCELKDLCIPNYCNNGGTCVMNPPTGLPTCKCPSGFGGDFCDNANQGFCDRFCVPGSLCYQQKGVPEIMCLCEQGPPCTLGSITTTETSTSTISTTTTTTTTTTTSTTTKTTSTPTTTSTRTTTVVTIPRTSAISSRSDEIASTSPTNQWPDGNESVSPGQVGITLSLPTGTNTWTLPDGTIITSFPNGTIIGTFPNGTTWVYPEGTTIGTFPNGTVIATFPNGTISTFPNGTIWTLPDGTIWTPPQITTWSIQQRMSTLQPTVFSPTQPDPFTQMAPVQCGNVQCFYGTCNVQGNVCVCHSGYTGVSCDKRPDQFVGNHYQMNIQPGDGAHGSDASTLHYVLILVVALVVLFLAVVIIVAILAYFKYKNGSNRSTTTAVQKERATSSDVQKKESKNDTRKAEKPEKRERKPSVHEQALPSPKSKPGDPQQRQLEQQQRQTHMQQPFQPQTASNQSPVQPATVHDVKIESQVQPQQPVLLQNPTYYQKEQQLHQQQFPEQSKLLGSGKSDRDVPPMSRSTEFDQKDARSNRQRLNEDVDFDSRSNGRVNRSTNPPPFSDSRRYSEPGSPVKSNRSPRRIRSADSGASSPLVEPVRFERESYASDENSSTPASSYKSKSRQRPDRFASRQEELPSSPEVRIDMNPREQKRDRRTPRKQSPRRSVPKQTRESGRERHKPEIQDRRQENYDSDFSSTTPASTIQSKPQKKQELAKRRNSEPPSAPHVVIANERPKKKERDDSRSPRQKSSQDKDQAGSRKNQRLGEPGRKQDQKYRPPEKLRAPSSDRDRPSTSKAGPSGKAADAVPEYKVPVTPQLVSNAILLTNRRGSLNDRPMAEVPNRVSRPKNDLRRESGKDRDFQPFPSGIPSKVSLVSRGRSVNKCEDEAPRVGSPSSSESHLSNSSMGDSLHRCQGGESKHGPRRHNDAHSGSTHSNQLVEQWLLDENQDYPIAANAALGLTAQPIRPYSDNSEVTTSIWNSMYDQFPSLMPGLPMVADGLAIDMPKTDEGRKDCQDVEPKV